MAIAVPTLTPKSWGEAIDALYLDDWNKELGRYRSSLAFRGMVDASWSMQTSLMRLGGKFEDVERHLLRNFRKYAHRDVVDKDSFWYWLAVAQHHGLPTRLLDWTYSPFVALHFATDDMSRMNVDGVVWCANLPVINKFLPIALREALTQERSYVFTIDMLASFESPAQRLDPTGSLGSAETSQRQQLRNLGDFDNIATKNDFALFFEPPSIDDRIVNQFALFSVISNPTSKMDDILQKRPTRHRKVVIPASLKWEIRDRLDQANITERVVYPGMDGLTRWLKRHYSSAAI